MSFYNILFGQNPMSKVLLAMLNLSTEKVGRFRDCFISEGKIAVYTRNGGGNRDCWNDCDPQCTCPGCTIENHLPEHPNYLYDKDDDFDCTYATVYFSFPEKYKELLGALDSGKPFDPDQRWLDMIDSISNMDLQKGAE